MARFLVLALLAFLVAAVVPETLGGDTFFTAASAADDAYGGAKEKVGVVPSIQQGLAPAVTAVVVFAIVLGISSIAVWPTISKGLTDRENKIREEIAAAEAARAQAKAALESYEQSLSEARAEAQRMLDETKTKQAELAAELRSKADRELENLRDKAMRDIEAARKAALNDIYAESVTLATAMAGKILQREVTASDQDRLIEESLAELAATRDN
ncbi:MAG: F0F1 ATP synthase subunit B [Planctomycetota bacterium]